jgi:hypothetical protein
MSANAIAASAPPQEPQSSNPVLAVDGELASNPDSINQPSPTTITRLKGPSELYSNPRLAALRIRSPSTYTGLPILINPKCSGYFVEPVCHPAFPQSHHALLFKIDEMDGPFFICRLACREDYVSQQKM